MRSPLGRFLPLVLLAGPALAGPRKMPPHAPIYTPDPRLWRLDVQPDLGGWMNQATVELRLKVVDPKDPKPPVEAQVRDPYADGEAWAEGQDQERDWDAERQWNEEESRRTKWRQRKVQYWLNGTPGILEIQVGHTATFEISCQNGENRLEILQPDSGQRAVRTWWASSDRTRLRIQKLNTQRGLWGDEETFWGGGHLEILEPDGQLLSPGRKSKSGGSLTYDSEYSNPAPPAGAYTLRWTGTWQGEKPFRVLVEALLDGGTEQERRWRFEKLILPGAGPVTLGTLDVEP